MFDHWLATKLQVTLSYSANEVWQTTPGGLGATSLPDTEWFNCCQASGEGQPGESYVGLHHGDSDRLEEGKADTKVAANGIRNSFMDML